MKSVFEGMDKRYDVLAGSLAKYRVNPSDPEPKPFGCKGTSKRNFCAWLTLRLLADIKAQLEYADVLQLGLVCFAWLRH